MIKNILQIPYVIDNASFHNSIKDELLSHIDKSDSETKQQTDDYYSDNIYKLDWFKNTDFDRPWFKYFQPHFQKQIIKMINELGFDSYFLVATWYQQYLNNSTHGWHTHSDNYTGVYYLELPEDTPKTQIVNPVNQKEVIDLDIKEGDFVLFPSFVIHRAPINKSNNRKTIISFDINIDKIKPDVLEVLND